MVMANEIMVCSYLCVVPHPGLQAEDIPSFVVLVSIIFSTNRDMLFFWHFVSTLLQMHPTPHTHLNKLKGHVTE